MPHSFLSYIVLVAATGWIIYRQFVGRFATTQPGFIIPLVLIAFGIQQLYSANFQWVTFTAVMVASDLMVATILGAVRGSAISLSVRDGYLFQRGGWLSLALWVVSIAVRVLISVLLASTVASAAISATLLLSFGVSVVTQYAVLAARINASSHPIQPVKH